jgi:hypothetical protein
MGDRTVSMSILLLAAAVAFHAIAPARADPPAGPTPVCQKFKGSMVGGFPPDEVVGWMTERRAAGHTAFVAPATYPTWAMICAY